RRLRLQAGAHVSVAGWYWRQLAHWLREPRAERARYEQLVTEAVARGELRAGTDARVVARLIEVPLCGSFLTWLLNREGPAARRLRKDLDAALRPYLTGRV